MDQDTLQWIIIGVMFVVFLVWIFKKGGGGL